MRALGARLRTARIDAGVTIKAAAACCGVNRQTVYRWEWGAAEPPLEVLRQLAAFYGSTVGWFANGERPASRKSADSGRG